MNSRSHVQTDLSNGQGMVQRPAGLCLQIRGSCDHRPCAYLYNHPRAQVPMSEALEEVVEDGNPRRMHEYSSHGTIRDLHYIMSVDVANFFKDPRSK